MNVMKKAENILVLLVLFWCSAIIGAPLLAIAGGFFESASVILYKFFSVICHQFESRTFHIGGHLLGVCERCTAIYFGFLAGSIWMRFRKTKDIQTMHPRVLLMIISLPIFIDGTLSFTPWYESTMVSRVISGGIFGFGLVWFLYHSLTEIIFSLINSNQFNYESTTR